MCVPELYPQRTDLGKCGNRNFKGKKVISQVIIETRHPKPDQ
jgi:hypothetical protein